MVESNFEGHSEEWKEVWKPEYVRTVAAFYNTAGGVLTFGRKDDGTYIGIDNPKKILKSISDTISNKLHISVEVRIVDIGAVHCIKVFVPKGDGLVDCDGVYYIRVGNTTQVLSGVKLKSRFLSEKHLQWLDAPTDLSVGDLSPNAISYLIRAGQKAGRIPVEISDTEVDSLLHRFNLIDSGKVTLCGALLFSDEPTLLHNYPPARAKTEKIPCLNF